MSSISLSNSLNLIRQNITTIIPKLSRGFASPAPVKVPITLHGIDGRYATALFSAASKTNNLNNVESELKQVKSAIKKDAKLSNFLEDPSLNRNQKKLGVQELLKQGKYCDTTKNFFQVLAENGRLNVTIKIIDAYTSLMAAHRGEIFVTIITAKELDPKLLDKLKTTLSKSKFVKPNQKLRIENKINPSILGGLMIEFGEDQTIDLSVASKIAKLNKLLTDVI
ncbi:20288_t:CDS:2 [Dentiscutata erythropus]|uniref:ATP synthase subunit 5, mitochondrial n=1 Tax=Dentiscutata erythropus TaxID=1348616 RepID=A0A9N9C3P0_9GLOM|nr:20288_t:CDS:2 [Dentiscutata erythropus]